MTTMSESIRIGDREVGPAAPPFVVAEISGNHNGSLDRAHAIIEMAADAGAHAVKLQTYTADTITIDSDRPEFLIGESHELWGSRRLYELYEQAHTPWEWHAELFAHARERGLIPFSSPFDDTAVELLEQLEAPVY
jgi:sialic acid synthase SpsE